MSKRSIMALPVSAFACAILNAEELPLIHQPTLTPQNSGTINGLIAVWPVNMLGELYSVRRERAADKRPKFICSKPKRKPSKLLSAGATQRGQSAS